MLKIHAMIGMIMIIIVVLVLSIFIDTNLNKIIQKTELVVIEDSYTEVVYSNDDSYSSSTVLFIKLQDGRIFNAESRNKLKHQEVNLITYKGNIFGVKSYLICPINAKTCLRVN